MKPEFTQSGIEIQTFQEIYDDRVASYKEIYGNDINVDPDTPDGQRIAFESQIELDLQSFGLTMYQQSDPDFAFGQSQQRIMKLAGVTIRPATRSQVDVEITTDRPVTLDENYTARDTLGQSWIRLTSVSIPAGTTTVTLFSEEFGAIEAGAGTVTEQATFVIGVTSLTNPLAATVGIEEETEEQARQRRNRSLESPTSSSIGRMITAIGNINNVTDLAVYENDEDVTDARGIPAHSLWVVVEGGAVSDIVETMVLNKTGGKPMVGAITSTYTETVIRPDNSEFEIIHTMTFDRPTYTPIFVRLDAKRKNALNPVDTALIAQEIASRTFNIGDNVIASDWYSDAFRAGDGFIPYNLEISDDGITWTDERLIAGLPEKYTIDEGDVTVTDIP